VCVCNRLCLRAHVMNVRREGLTGREEKGGEGGDGEGGEGGGGGGVRKKNTHMRAHTYTHIQHIHHTHTHIHTNTHTRYYKKNGKLINL
jgi:hypothetical protein